jgi:hypothetical protein
MMNAKVKNDPSRYITRSSLAGAVLEKKKLPVRPTVDRLEQEMRNVHGAIDARWYIQLPPKS